MLFLSFTRKDKISTVGIKTIQRIKFDTERIEILRKEKTISLPVALVFEKKCNGLLWGIAL